MPSQIHRRVNHGETFLRTAVGHRRLHQHMPADPRRPSPRPPTLMDCRIAAAPRLHRRRPHLHGLHLCSPPDASSLPHGCLAAHRICAAPRPTPPVLGQHAARARCWLDETETKKRPYETNAEQSPASLSLSLLYYLTSIFSTPAIYLLCKTWKTEYFIRELQWAR
jgi:hypothetical protein